MRKIKCGNKVYYGTKVKGTKSQYKIKDSNGIYKGTFRSIEAFRKERKEKHDAGYGW